MTFTEQRFFKGGGLVDAGMFLLISECHWRTALHATLS
jgi:hypothetical protein